MPVKAAKRYVEVRAFFQVSSVFVSIIHQHWRQSGHVHSKPIGGNRRALLLEPYEADLTEQRSVHPFMTLKAKQAWLESEQGLIHSILAIDKFVRQKLGYRNKKL